MDWRLLQVYLNQIDLYRLTLVYKTAYEQLNPKLKELNKFLNIRCNVLTIHTSYVIHKNTFHINHDNPSYTLSDKYQSSKFGSSPNLWGEFISKKQYRRIIYKSYNLGDINIFTKEIIEENNIKLNKGDIIIYESIPHIKYIYNKDIYIMAHTSKFYLENSPIYNWVNVTRRIDYYNMDEFNKYFSRGSKFLEIYIKILNINLIFNIDYAFSGKKWSHYWLGKKLFRIEACIKYPDIVSNNRAVL